MKKWEEEQRKKQHQKKVAQAKSTLGGQANRKRTDSLRLAANQIVGAEGTQILAISNGVPISVASSVYSKPSFVGSTGSASSTSKHTRLAQSNSNTRPPGFVAGR